MLKKIRAAAALFIFCLLTFYFIDFTGLLPADVYLQRVQFVPALLSLNAAAMVFLLVCAALFGRVYCSVVCPLGVLQDIAWRCSKRRRTFGKNYSALRLSVLAACLVPFLFGFALILGILDPYSAYGRIAVHLFKPVYMMFNNALAYTFNHFGNYAFYRVELTALGVFSIVTSVLTIAVITILAYAKGRLYCNTVCPVGTVLGYLNKYALFKIRIDKDKCASCGVCEKKCKASCINAEAKAVDYGRCVNCFNCINNCAKKAVSFSLVRSHACPNKTGEHSSPLQHIYDTDCRGELRSPVVVSINSNLVQENADTVDGGKREFLLAGLTAALAAPALFSAAKADSAVDGGKERRTAISPPGSVGAERLLKHCTSCHLCVSKCPARVLKPAFMEYGVGGLMMPVMYFEKGFCNFDCTICADICPARALLPLTKEQKHRLQVGRVVFIPDRCVVVTNGTSCGACSEHCPTQAVKMVAYKNGLTIPSVDADICVGCGGCEFICPVRPYRAIYVEGNRVHKQARAFEVEQNAENEITDFGF